MNRIYICYSSSTKEDQNLKKQYLSASQKLCVCIYIHTYMYTHTHGNSFQIEFYLRMD